jgi:hypothetical protein
MERISAANKMVVLKVVKEGHILGQTYQRYNKMQIIKVPQIGHGKLFIYCNMLNNFTDCT